MSTFLQEITEGKIDFAGQSLVDLVARVVLAASAVFAFGVGFALQDLRITFGIVGASTLGLALLLLPPWPMFNRHPVKWLPVKSKLQ
ncbi:microsomal signal peptidase 12kDa subunit [Flammula alnicola]|nr:microsomal signal peptidase 12kDa subunit [Flammula alnicola]